MISRDCAHIFCCAPGESTKGHNLARGEALDFSPCSEEVNNCPPLLCQHPIQRRRCFCTPVAFMHVCFYANRGGSTGGYQARNAFTLNQHGVQLEVGVQLGMSWCRAKPHFRPGSGRIQPASPNNHPRIQIRLWPGSWRLHFANFLKN